MTDDDTRLAGFREGMQSIHQIAEAVNAAHPEHGDTGPCGGLDSCPACQDMWRRLTGGRGVCIPCGRTRIASEYRLGEKMARDAAKPLKRGRKPGENRRGS